MQLCGHCNHEVAYNAKACPNCGGLWPVYGRSPMKLTIEKIHSVVQVRGPFIPIFESNPKSYLELILEIVLAILGFSLAGLFFLTGMSLLRALTYKWTGDIEALANINSISSFLSLGVDMITWLVMVLISLAVGAFLLARGMAYYRKTRR